MVLAGIQSLLYMWFKNEMPASLNLSFHFPKEERKNERGRERRTKEGKGWREDMTRYFTDNGWCGPNHPILQQFLLTVSLSSFNSMLDSCKNILVSKCISTWVELFNQDSRLTIAGTLRIAKQHLRSRHEEHWVLYVGCKEQVIYVSYTPVELFKGKQSTYRNRWTCHAS